MNTTTTEKACDPSNWRWKRWDVRSDGKVFWAYNKNAVNGEHWTSFDKVVKLSKSSSELSKKLYQSNPTKNKESVKRWKSKNKEKVKEYKKRWRSLKSSKIKSKEWRSQNKDKIVAQRLRYLKSGKRSLYEKNKKNNDLLFAIKHRMRSRICVFLKRSGYSKQSKTQDMLGCDWSYLKAHLESQFVDGMSWENRSLWHIDHIIPLASAKSVEEVIKLCHYTNLQPLWAEDNLRKGANAS